MADTPRDITASGGQCLENGAQETSEVLKTTGSGGDEAGDYRFGAFRLAPRTRQLFDGDRLVPVTPKAFDVLLYLVEHGGVLVEKDQLLRVIWPQTFVEESNLAQNIFVLRKALGESSRDHRFIVTEPGRGYRFVAPVTRVGPVAAPPEPHPFPPRRHGTAGFRPIAMGVASAAIAIAVSIVVWSWPIDTGLKSDAAQRYGGGPGSTTNFEAYEAFLKGRYFWNKRTKPTLETSARYFAAAVARDPAYAQAWAGLADAQALLGQAEDAKASARRALAIEPALPEPHATLGLQYLFADWKLADAEVEFTTARRLNPNYATAHHWYAFLLLARARTGDAVREMRRALELDPLSNIISTDLCQALHFDGRDDEAIAQCYQVLEIDPDFSMAHRRLGEIYLKQHRWNEAVAELKRAGWSATLLRVIETKGRVRPDVLPDAEFVIAQAYTVVGQRDQALEWIARAVSLHRPEIVLIGVDPLFAALRNDREFKAALGL